MSGWRPERVAEMVHRELAQRLREDVKDPDLGPISITGVDVSRDLGRAVVRFLPLGGGEAGPELDAALGRAARTLRGPVGRALRLRTAPELVFVRDADLERAVRVTSLLDEVGRELRGAHRTEDEP
jgi:ribosome-binding factor A